MRVVASCLNNLIIFGLALAEPLQETQVDQKVDERVLIGNGAAIPEMGPLNAEGHGLAVDALDGRALPIELLVVVALAIQRIAQARTDADRHHSCASTGLPLRVMDRAAMPGALGKQYRTDVLTALMLNQACGAVGVGELQGHGQTGRTQG